jgi:hypothetical protein
MGVRTGCVGGGVRFPWLLRFWRLLELRAVFLDRRRFMVSVSAFRSHLVGGLPGSDRFSVIEKLFGGSLPVPACHLRLPWWCWFVAFTPVHDTGQGHHGHKPYEEQG